jgi:hypothetical protein
MKKGLVIGKFHRYPHWAQNPHGGWLCGKIHMEMHIDCISYG